MANTAERLSEFAMVNTDSMSGGAAMSLTGAATDSDGMTTLGFAGAVRSVIVGLLKTGFTNTDGTTGKSKS